MEPDWRLLGAPELLQLISEKLTSIADSVRFRAVCPAWRLASSPRPRHLPAQLPWLILPRGPGRRIADANLDSSSLSVYDLSQSKTHTLHLPQIEGKYISGSSHGWLVLECWNDRGVWLFNPITGDQISLPPVSAEPRFLNGGFVDHPDSLSIRKAILSFNPSLDPDCFVMGLLRGSYDTGFCRVGDDCWTILDVRDIPGITVPRCSVADIIYHNHLFYGIYSNGKAWSWDIRKHFGKMVSSGWRDQEGFDYICTVEGISGEHGLMIFFQGGSYQAAPDLYMSDILMLYDQQQLWSDDVDEQLTACSCFFVADDFHCFSLPLADLKLHGWAGNCICYTSQKLEKRIDDIEWYNYSIMLYKLDDRSITTLASNLGLIKRYNSAYLRKDAWLLWLTPTLS